MKKSFAMALGLALAVQGVGIPTADAKSIERIRVPENFDYETQRTVPVNITVLMPSSGRAAVSFYSRTGKDNLRLLDTRFTAEDGTYRGALTLPAALRQVTVTARYAGNTTEVKVPVRRKGIVKRIDVRQ